MCRQCLPFSKTLLSDERSLTRRAHIRSYDPPKVNAYIMNWIVCITATSIQSGHFPGRVKSIENLIWRETKNVKASQEFNRPVMEIDLSVKIVV